MATYSSILAWRIPWTEEPGGLQFISWQRVGHDWVTKFSLFHFSQSENGFCTFKNTGLSVPIGLWHSWCRGHKVECQVPSLGDQLAASILCTHTHTHTHRYIFLLKYRWFTVLCFRCTVEWFRYICIYSFSDSFPLYKIVNVVLCVTQ